MPGSISLGIGEYDDVCRLVISADSVEEEDRQGLTVDVLPLDPGDLATDEPGVVFPFDWRWCAHDDPFL